MNILINLVTIAAVATVMVGTAVDTFAQRPTRRDNGRLPGDVQLEKSPLPLDEFEKNALQVLSDIQANEQFRNVPEHDGRLLRIMTRSMVPNMSSSWEHRQESPGSGSGWA